MADKNVGGLLDILGQVQKIRDLLNGIGGGNLPQTLDKIADVMHQAETFIRDAASFLKSFGPETPRFTTPKEVKAASDLEAVRDELATVAEAADQESSGPVKGFGGGLLAGLIAKVVVEIVNRLLENRK